MKKLAVIVVFSVLSYMNYAQLKTQDVFAKNDMVWYGLDFSKAKFIGRFENAAGLPPISSYEIAVKYIPAWNELIVLEPYNFDLQSTFRKMSVYYDLKPVEASNATIPVADLITMNSNSIAKADLQKIVSEYKTGDKKEGLGLVFVIESFDKPRTLASMWVVFFDIETKKILLSEYCQGEPGGFGIRNYWAGSFKRVLKDIRFWKFERWRRESLKSGFSEMASKKTD